MRTKRLVAIFILLLPILLSFSNELYFTQISTKDGLSQNTVRTILENRKGFIWAGTMDGINRYDGYQIVTYKPQSGNPKSLIDHRIKDIFEDKDGYLWIKTYKNVFCCYNPVKDSFVDYNNHELDNPNYYSNFYESPTGTIWLWGDVSGCLQLKKTDGKIVSRSFLSNYINDNKKVFKFLVEDSKSTIWVGGETGLFKINGDKVQALFENKKYKFTRAIELNNKMYFTTENGMVVEYDLKRNSFHEINLAPTIGELPIINVARLGNNELLLVVKSLGLFSLNVNNKQLVQLEWMKDKDLTGNIQLIVDKELGIWVYNHSGIVWYYSQQTQNTQKMRLIPPEIAKIIDLERYNVFIDSKQIVWITTYGNGLFCYDRTKNSLVNYKYNPNKNSLASDYLLAITEDRFGNIWVGSEYAGIVKIVKPTYDIRIVRPEKDTSIGKNNNVRTICEDSYNNIWVGTKNGSLHVYNHELTSSKCVYEDMNPYTLLEDKKHQMWVGTKGQGLYLLNARTFAQIGHYMDGTNISSISNKTIFSILEDSKGRIWIGTFGGGINLVEDTGKGFSFHRFFENSGNKSYIRHLYQDSKGRFWAGTSDGIIRFDAEELIKNPQTFKTYKMDLKSRNSLSCNDVKTIYEDDAGQIWVGTAGGGLNRFVEGTDKVEEYFVAYTVRDGLAGDIVSGILEDDEHNLWISSENGITKFDKKGHSFMSYHFSERTYGNHFNENANIFTTTGDMCWGSLDGLLVFNPKSFVPQKETPPVTFTSFMLYNQRVEVGGVDSPLRQSISYVDKIKLNYKQNTFTIEFASLTLKDPEKNKYTYMLEKYDKTWSNVSHDNSATYKNLPPGNYTFKVRGTNSDGIWNATITELQLTITPPYWKSGYAYMTYLILIVAALYLGFRLIYKFNRLNNAVEVEKQLTNHKLRFFTNISHEFRTPLTLIRGAVENLNDQNEVPERIKKQIQVLSRSSAHLTRLIDQLLEFRKIQNNVLTLDLEEIDIVEFVREIYAGFSEIGKQKNIDYQFVSDLPSFNMYIDRRKMDKIIYNLLSNAFKFTSKDGKIELRIRFDSKNETCLISVLDNGIGIDKDKQHLIFSRFMQINFSSSGTGVGLSLVKDFVDVHKGKVWYESNGERGSIFNVELSTSLINYEGANFIVSSHPDIVEEKKLLKVHYPSDLVEMALPDIEESTLANYKILVIDDNKDIRDFLVDEFSKHFMIDVAEDGKIGMAKAIENNPDLIICDVMMPEMDGFEVTRRLKDEFQTCHIPIILLTAHSSLEHQLEGIQSGADAYIMKPFSLKYLVTRVFKLIEQREQLKKRFSNEYVLDGNLITTTDKDKDFYNLIDRILEEHIDDAQFTVDRFAELSKLRRTIFYKKVKGITGFSPNELIKVKRLKRGAELLLTGEFTVSEVAYKVGFDDPFYFSKCFKTQYNCSPSKYGQAKFEG